jgi:DDE family transposase|tara:strand:+ start:220 stop:708 length:489 start_codon:yes stop_codon:yes gene_type:complete
MFNRPNTHEITDTPYFTRHDFIYDALKDHYVCPAGALLTKTERRFDHILDTDRYRNLTACQNCTLRPQCTPTEQRLIKRWSHEHVMDAMQERLDNMPDAMKIRRQTVEHPFGTLKSWMGSTHFLTKTIEKVKTEMNLHVLAYNIKRMIQIFGIIPLIQAIRA